MHEIADWPIPTKRLPFLFVFITIDTACAYVVRSSYTTYLKFNRSGQHCRIILAKPFIWERVYTKLFHAHKVVSSKIRFKQMSNAICSLHKIINCHFTFLQFTIVSTLIFHGWLQIYLNFFYYASKY